MQLHPKIQSRAIYSLRLCDRPDFCDPPGRAKKSLGPAGPGFGPEKMTKNGLKKLDAATFLLDLVFQSQTYMVGTKSKDYLFEEFIKLQLLFHLQIKKKIALGGD